jgi:hypothetical protein
MIVGKRQFVNNSVRMPHGVRIQWIHRTLNAPEFHLRDVAIGRTWAKRKDGTLADRLKGSGKITSFEHDDMII